MKLKKERAASLQRAKRVRHQSFEAFFIHEKFSSPINTGMTIQTEHRLAVHGGSSVVLVKTVVYHTLGTLMPYPSEDPTRAGWFLLD